MKMTAIEDALARVLDHANRAADELRTVRLEIQRLQSEIANANIAKVTAARDKRERRAK